MQYIILISRLIVHNVRVADWLEEAVLAANTVGSKRSVTDIVEEFNLFRQSIILLLKNMDDEMLLQPIT